VKAARFGQYVPQTRFSPLTLPYGQAINENASHGRGSRKRDFPISHTMKAARFGQYLPQTRFSPLTLPLLGSYQ
jgi:hypothetical protein